MEEPNPTLVIDKQEPATEQLTTEQLVAMVVSARRGVREEALKVEELKKKAVRDEIGKKKSAYHQEQMKAFVKEQTAAVDAYPGFDKGWDEQAFAILAMTGVSPSMQSIIVVPDDQGLGKDNPAIALMSPDKVELIEGLVRSAYGPGTFKAKTPVDYARLLERIRLGTIVVSAGELNDSLKTKAIIWHEYGHQSLGHTAETGDVFALEISQVAKNFGSAAAHEWILTGRKQGAAYFAEYGLKNEPGCRKLLAELKKHLSADEFTTYYGKAELALLDPSERKESKDSKDESKEEAATGVKASGNVWIGKVAGRNRFALSEDGPFVYGTLRAADEDRLLVADVLSQAASAFPGVDPGELNRLVVKHVLNTAKKVQ
jgi:hypothetical protein